MCVRVLCVYVCVCVCVVCGGGGEDGGLHVYVLEIPRWDPIVKSYCSKILVFVCLLQVKLSGFYAMVPRSYDYPHRAAFGYVELALEAFGVSRLCACHRYPTTQHFNFLCGICTDAKVPHEVAVLSSAVAPCAQGLGIRLSSSRWSGRRQLPADSRNAGRNAIPRWDNASDFAPNIAPDFDLILLLIWSTAAPYCPTVAPDFDPE